MSFWLICRTLNPAKLKHEPRNHIHKIPVRITEHRQAVSHSRETVVDIIRQPVVAPGTPMNIPGRVINRDRIKLALNTRPLIRQMI